MARTNTNTGGGAGVTSLNGLVGVVTISAGAGITLTPVGNDISIAYTGGGIAIGDAVGGGTDPSVLYLDGGGLLAQDPTNFYYDPTVQFDVKMGSLELINGAFAYQPVGPLYFAGARYLTSLTPYDSYAGMLVAGGVGKPIMRVLGTTGNQGLVQVDISTVDLRADIDVNNLTRIAMAAGGVPDINITTQSNSNAVSIELDPTTKKLTQTATDGTNSTILTLDGSATPIANILSTDGTNTVNLTLNANTPTAVLNADDGGGNHSTIIQLNGSTGGISLTGYDGTNTVSEQFTLAVPEWRASVNDGSDSNAIAVNQHWTEFGGGMVYNTTVVTANVATVTLDENSSILVVNKTVAGAITVNLPPSANITTGFTLVIKDGKGDALTNNITIDGDGGETIDGAATYVMAIPYQSTTVLWNGTQWNVI